MTGGDSGSDNSIDPFVQSLMGDSAGEVDLLRFITAGGVNDGKSTLIGRLLFETKAFHTRVEFFSQLLHGRRFHSGPEHSRRAVSREKSDAAHRYGEGNPRKTCKGGVNIVGSFLGYFADELERDMNGFGRNPSSRVGQRLELSLELAKLFAKFIWKINSDKDSH